MKKAAVGIAILCVTLGTWQLIASAGAGATTPAQSAATTADITFREGFCSDAGAHCKVIGDQKDPSAYGNQLLFTIPLTQNGNRIGYEQGSCTYLQKTSASDFCAYNLHLPDGSVSVQGTLPISTVKSGTIPVTGGTRGYLDAGGTLQLLSGSFDYELRLTIP
jgi:hypothetical protein